MRYTPSLFYTLAATICLGALFPSNAKADRDAFFGKVPVKINPNTKAPKEKTADAFGSEQTIDGRTDIPLDSKSRLAQNYLDQEESKQIRTQIDRSIRADIASGQPVKILIAPEHFVQLSFMKENEIVFPKRAFTGQPDLLVIDKRDGSPNVYVAAAVPIEGHSTNLFVETEEDGKIQTYVLDLIVTKPERIRAQVQVNLVHDKTPPMRGREGSEIDPNKNLPETKTGSNRSVTPTYKQNQTGHGEVEPFTDKEIKKYLHTMIKMTEQYSDAKNIEEKTGRIIYKDSDIQIFPGGALPWEDPIERIQWKVHQVWYFKKYDAILLDVRLKNDTATPSNWDYSQVHWMINRAQTHYPTTSASPYRMQTKPYSTNQVWYLIQGNSIDPNSDFGPVFPRPERRGTREEPTLQNPNNTSAATVRSAPNTSPVRQTSSDGKTLIPITK